MEYFLRRKNLKFFLFFFKAIIPGAQHDNVISDNKQMISENEHVCTPYWR